MLARIREGEESTYSFRDEVAADGVAPFGDCAKQTCWNWREDTHGLVDASAHVRKVFENFEADVFLLLKGASDLGDELIVYVTMLHQEVRPASQERCRGLASCNTVPRKHYQSDGTRATYMNRAELTRISSSFSSCFASLFLRM